MKFCRYFCGGGQTLPASIQTSVKFPDLTNIFAILKDTTFNLGHFANFMVLFLAASGFLLLLLYQNLKLLW